MTCKHLNRLTWKSGQATNKASSKSTLLISTQGSFFLIFRFVDLLESYRSIITFENDKKTQKQSTLRMEFMELFIGNTSWMGRLLPWGSSTFYQTVCRLFICTTIQVHIGLSLLRAELLYDSPLVTDCHRENISKVIDLAVWVVCEQFESSLRAVGYFENSLKVFWEQIKSILWAV